MAYDKNGNYRNYDGSNYQQPETDWQRLVREEQERINNSARRAEQQRIEDAFWGKSNYGNGQKPAGSPDPILPDDSKLLQMVEALKSEIIANRLERQRATTVSNTKAELDAAISLATRLKADIAAKQKEVESLKRQVTDTVRSMEQLRSTNWNQSDEIRLLKIDLDLARRKQAPSVSPLDLSLWRRILKLVHSDYHKANAAEADEVTKLVLKLKPEGR